VGLTEVDIRRILWTFAQAFLASFLTLAAGILAAPNFDTAKALAVSALLASIAAAISAVKNLVLDDGSSLK
jgi:ferric-dicitrate binding protein FerR (iron transport regulator)